MIGNDAVEGIATNHLNEKLGIERTFELSYIYKNHKDFNEFVNMS